MSEHFSSGQLKKDYANILKADKVEGTGSRHLWTCLQEETLMLFDSRMYLSHDVTWKNFIAIETKRSDLSDELVASI